MSAITSIRSIWSWQCSAVGYNDLVWNVIKPTVVLQGDFNHPRCRLYVIWTEIQLWVLANSPAFPAILLTTLRQWFVTQHTVLVANKKQRRCGRFYTMLVHLGPRQLGHQCRQVPTKGLEPTTSPPCLVVAVRWASWVRTTASWAAVEDMADTKPRVQTWKGWRGA